MANGSPGNAENYDDYVDANGTDDHDDCDHADDDANIVLLMAVMTFEFRSGH